MSSRRPARRRRLSDDERRASDERRRKAPREKKSAGGGPAPAPAFAPASAAPGAVALTADVLFGGAPDRAEASRRKKEQQLCRQVCEAVTMALAGERDPLLLDVAIVGVEPAPDASRLAVVVRAPEGDRAELLERLERAAGRLRSEVAAEITRKRTPALVFRIAADEEDAS